MVEEMVKIPEEMSSELAEGLGAHIGDGSMGIYNKTHLISFSGHQVDDKEYVEWVQENFKQLFGLDPNLRTWSGTYGFQVSSKKIVEFMRNIGIPLGPKNNIKIPEIIKKSNQEIIASCIRGIFDTDGTLYFEPKYGKKPYYPRIQLKNKSKELAEDVHEMLQDMKIRSTTYSNKEKDGIYHFVEVRGEENLFKWMKKISFRNKKHLNKFKIWRKLGYYDKKQFKKSISSTS